jgi:hypothetical protein
LSDVPNQNSVETEKRSWPEGVPRLLDGPVGQVLRNGDGALNRACQRVIAEWGHDDQHYAAHGSSPAI